MKKGDYVFALFYPIANTQEDQHTLKEGNIISMVGANENKRIFQVNFPFQPGQSGAPIFNGNGEVIGFALTNQDLKKVLGVDAPTSTSSGFALKSSTITGLSEIRSRNTIGAKSKPLNLSKGLSYFKEGIQKNIVLIETGN
jgi:S1-C subfamily serine protease